jgi:phenylalanyl-tRNA synthetase beta chain
LGFSLYLDATFFPDRAAKIFYRPPTSSSTKNAHLVDVVSASKEEESAPLPNTIPEPSLTNDFADGSTTTRTGLGSGTVLNNLKETLGRALPTMGNKGQGAIQIGELGILHPTVLEQFELDYPCSTLEFNLEPFL